MYRSAGPTWKISKRTQAEIHKIHLTLPMMPRFLLGESDVDGISFAVPEIWEDISNENLGTFVYGYRCRDLVSGADECPRCPNDPETTDGASMESR